MLVNENGIVVEANTVSGHPLLLSAVEMAQDAKFRPTFPGDESVKVSDILVYDFAPEKK